MHRETKEAPDVPGLSRKHLSSRDQGALDAPILSHGINQAKARIR